jgi:hypothetical protein
MKDMDQFIVETGVDIYEKKPRYRHGKWKALAQKMNPPKKDPRTGKIIYDSVSHTQEGTALSRSDATGLSNALARLGCKSASRRNGSGGFRVWRIG